MQGIIGRRNQGKHDIDLLCKSGTAGGQSRAAYVSPFIGRIDDISMSGMDLIRSIVEIFSYTDLQTEIIAASVRNPVHVTECALAGADIATVPYKVLKQMIHHPLTDVGIEKFRKDYLDTLK